MAVAIYLNGKKEDIPEGTSVSRLLEIKKIRPEVVTVELNEQILEKRKYPETLLSPNDRLEFVYYMGGGIFINTISKREELGCLFSRE